VAYGLRDSLELLRALGAEPGVGRVSGGGARSELWLRIVASVLGLPLERMETDEGSAFGAALLAGVREEVFSDAEEAVARCVRVRGVVEPEWDYEAGYDRFRGLYRALDQPVPFRDGPAERVGQADDHVEERGHLRSVAQGLAGDAGRERRLGVC